MKKVYYKLNLELLSPLALGSGQGNVVDKCVTVDSENLPYIPASSIAGIMKSAAKSDCRDDLFGTVSERVIQSRIYTYDAVLADKNFVVTVRDGVKLDDDKISSDGGKFDFEAVEPGAKFVTFVELQDDGNFEAETDRIISSLKEFYMGAKTTRGYGRIRIISAYKKSFDMNKDAELWLDFKLFDENAFDDKDLFVFADISSDKITLSASLALQGAITIRRYSTDYMKDDKGEPVKFPNDSKKIMGDADFTQITVKGDVPVIPGTSWAGVFRHHFVQVAKELKIEKAEALADNVFGFVSETEKTSQKSKIRFDESEISGAEEKIITRTVIDRFTGGSANTALFTEKVYFGGETTLNISLDAVSDEDELKKIMKILLVTLSDINNGLLAVGGQTSVGSGIFEVKSLVINKNDCSKAFESYSFDSCIEEVLK